MSNIGIPTWVFQLQPWNSEAREPTNKPYKIPCYAECFCFELGQRYLYYYNIFAFTIHKITVIGTDKNTQKQLKNLAAKNNSEPVKNTGTKVHYEFSNFFRHPNETAPLSLTSAHI